MKVSLTVGEVSMKLDLQEVSELEKLVILNNVFKMMGVKDELSELVGDYIKIGKAYREFYSGIENVEPSDKKPLDLKLRYPKKDEDEILTHVKKELDEHYPEPYPDYYKSGIIEEDGKKKYKCRLHCECGNNQNLYVETHRKNIDCPNCHKVHQVRNAKNEGFPKRDSWGNYFIAGKFVGEDDIHE